MLVRSCSPRNLAFPLLLIASSCGSSTEPAKSAGEPAPHAAPTFELTAPGEQLSPELNQLISQLELNNPSLADVSARIASHKHATATRRAGRKLIGFAERVAKPSWRENQRQEVSNANRKAGRIATEAQLQAQLEGMQTEALTPIYRAMQNLGGETVIEHCMAIVRNVAIPPDRRALALGVLSMQLPAGDARTAEVARFSKEIDGKMLAQRSTPAARQEARETIRKLGVPFKKCYDTELAKTPELAVRGQLALEIGKDGKVTSAKGKDLAPPSLTECVERAGMAAKFSARPEPHSMVIPILFKRN